MMNNDKLVLVTLESLAPLIAAAFVHRQILSISIGSDFHYLLSRAFGKVEKKLPCEYRMDFRIQSHPAHKYSVTVHELIARIVSLGYANYGGTRFTHLYFSMSQEKAYYGLDCLDENPLNEFVLEFVDAIIAEDVVTNNIHFA